MLDRFHYFIKGWKMTRIKMGQIYYGWTIDTEYFAEYMHYLRSQSCYKHIFEEIVSYDEKETDTRDCKAVMKGATALCKILFPHVKDLSELSTEDLEIFKKLYSSYCLEPAVEGCAVIRKQCHMIDKEFKAEMPQFEIHITLPPEQRDNEGETKTGEDE